LQRSWAAAQIRRSNFDLATFAGDSANLAAILPDCYRRGTSLSRQNAEHARPRCAA